MRSHRRRSAHGCAGEFCACTHASMLRSPRIFEVVLLRLGAKSAGVIGVPGRKARRGTQDHFVDTAHAPRSRQECPRVVGVVCVPVAIADPAAAAIFGGRESGIRRRAHPDVGSLEIRIGRQRFDLGASDVGVARQMAELGHLHQLLLRAGILLRHLAFEVAQIEVVGRDRLEVLVPHDLGRDVGIVGIEYRERLPGDVAEQVAMVRGQTHLAGVFFGRILVRRRPIDAARRDDVHLHAPRDRDESARTHQRADLLRILRRDRIAGFDLAMSWSEDECQRGKNCDDGQQIRDTCVRSIFSYSKVSL